MVEPKKPEGIEFSIEDCIAVLENIKGRTKHYDEMYPHFSKKYCEELAGMDCLVIDTVISALRSQE